MEINQDVLQKEEQIALALRTLYEKENFQLFRLNSFEDYDFYLDKKNFLSGDDVIKFNGSDGRLLALNPDVTLSIVKNTPVGVTRKVYYNENIFRHNQRSNEYRKLNQIGVEVIGEVDQQVEVGILHLALASLKIIGQGKLEISHSELIDSILAFFPEHLQAKVFNSLKNKNFQDIEKYSQRAELAPQQQNAILALMKLSGPLSEVLEQIGAIAPEIPGVAAAFNKLQELTASLSDETEFCAQDLDFDLSTVNDTNYYSGIIFQGFIENVPQAILYGGRYDGLFATLGKQQQAIGFGIYLDMLTENKATASNDSSQVINVALPKGRMGESVYQMFRDAGLVQENLLDDSRKLVFFDEVNQLRFFLVKPSDVASYVEHGAADIGVVGRDILMETGADVIDLMKFPLGECRIAVAGPKNFQEDTTRPLKVATKYPNITRRYFSERSRPVELIYLNGSIELAPIVGLSDVIVDIVETGNTLVENDLAVIKEITDSAAHLVVNRAAWRFKKAKLSQIIQRVSELND